MRWLRRMLTWVLGFIAGVVIVFLGILFARAFAARRLPPLKPWHQALSREITAREITDAWTLGDYLRREDEVFRQMNETVLPAVAPEDRNPYNRYWPDSPINPEKFPKNWNRTYELLPDGPIRGGALLIHGLTDSPYSVKAEAELLRSLGYYALCLRMPGHGTIPGGLVKAKWEDWRAAVRLGARHVRQRAGPGTPFVLGGYSNGGALSVQYALDALDDPKLPRPDRVLLFSPMIGVSAFAPLARIVAAIGAIPYFARSRWMDVLPEYIPFKYDSFPARAGQQTAQLTRAIKGSVRRAADSGRIKDLAPILAFVSLVDSTVETPATFESLFAYLPENGSELVLFDLNRYEFVAPFLKRSYDKEVAGLFSDPKRRYRLALVTNASANTRDVVARIEGAHATETTVTPLGMAWPPQIFSLSHLAVPFRPDDPLFGINPDMSVGYGPRLGLLAPRGERGVLSVSTDQFMRLNCNPFYPYVEERIRAFVPK
ncbi:MAG TPA: alpha/beta fold hydrolase [Thermoanaerobaculia bacterium]